MKVINLNGVEIDFDVAVELMNDEIREAVCKAFAPCNEQDFFTAYERAHAARFGEWELSKVNPVY